MRWRNGARKQFFVENIKPRTTNSATRRVRTIVHAENAAIDCATPIGQGAYQHSKHETTIMALRHRVVAIVDNDPSMLHAVESLLSARGYMTECYCSAEAFLAAASKATCLILDIGLDGMSGIELRRQLTTMDCTLAVIFMTGPDDERDAGRQSRRDPLATCRSRFRQIAYSLLSTG